MSIRGDGSEGNIGHIFTSFGSVIDSFLFFGARNCCLPKYVVRKEFSIYIMCVFSVNIESLAPPDPATQVSRTPPQAATISPGFQ